jgi:hypothetical protein
VGFWYSTFRGEADVNGILVPIRELVTSQLNDIWKRCTHPNRVCGAANNNCCLCAWGHHSTEAKMKVWKAVSAIGALMAAMPASAITYTVGPIDSGPVDATSSFAPGYTLYDFNDGSSPFTGGGVVSGTTTNSYVAPAGDTSPYFAVGPSTSTPASLALSAINQLSFYWGTIDTYNTISFDGLNQSFGGADFGGTDSDTTRPSRQVTFYFSPSESAALTGLTLKSGSNAFELDNLIFGSAAPEPGTWAMMIVGFGAAGVALRRRRKVAMPSAYAA